MPFRVLLMDEGATHVRPHGYALQCVWALNTWAQRRGQLGCLSLQLYVHAGALWCAVQSAGAADPQTGSCQQHTNKLSGENQSGL